MKVIDLVGITDICNKSNIPGYMVIADIVKAFDPLDHDFLIMEKLDSDVFLDWYSFHASLNS